MVGLSESDDSGFGDKGECRGSCFGKPFEKVTQKHFDRPNCGTRNLRDARKLDLLVMAVPVPALRHPNPSRQNADYPNDWRCRSRLRLEKLSLRVATVGGVP